MRWSVVAVAVLSGACSFVGVDRRPPVAEPSPPVDCTTSYMMPLIDLAVVAGLIGWSFYIAHDLAERDCEREECDPQDGIAVVLPYLYAPPAPR